MLKHQYSDGACNKRIIILGMVPPPLGGISVHIQRVIHQLKQQKNTVTLINSIHRGFMPWYVSKLFWTFFWQRPHSVYYHTAYLNSTLRELRLLLWLKKTLGFKLTLIEHNCRHLETRSIAYKKELSKAFTSIDHIVFIGHSTYKHYQQHLTLPKIYSIEAAFLPPVLAEEQRILATYPTSLYTFLQQHKPVLLVNASRLVMYQGRDLYGLDTSIQLVSDLRTTIPKAGLVIALSSINDQRHFAQLQAQCKALGITEHVYFLLDEKELWPLIKRVDVFLRPTLSDGESVSVQEALYFDLAVAASDVCKRPPKVFIFENKNYLSFLNTVQELQSKAPDNQSPIIQRHRYKIDRI